MRYQLFVCLLALIMLAVPAAVKGEKPVIDTPEISITGESATDAEITVTVTVTGENVIKVFLYIQACSGLSCYLPVEVEMESIGVDQYRGTFSDFEAEYEYYQYMVKGENGQGESKQTDFVKIEGLPGYEDNVTDDDDDPDDDDSASDNDTDKNTDDDFPGFEIALLLTAVMLLGVLIRIKYY